MGPNGSLEGAGPTAWDQVAPLEEQDQVAPWEKQGQVAPWEEQGQVAVWKEQDQRHGAMWLLGRSRAK